MPATLEWVLPPEDGVYALTVQGTDLVLERIGGSELARTAAAGAEVTVLGNPASQVLQVDLRAADPAAYPHVSAGGGGGEDSLRLAYGTGDDLLEAGPGGVRVSAGGVDVLQAVGFAAVEVNADPAVPGRARVQGSAGDDVARMDGGLVAFGSADPGWHVQLSGFTSVEVDGGAGGYDQIDLRDSAQSDEFRFAPAGGSLRRGDGISHTFGGFDRVTFTGDAGGTGDRDEVRLTGGGGGSSYRAVGRTGRFLDGENRFDVRLKRLDEVALDGTAGGFNVLSRGSHSYTIRTEGFRPIGRLEFEYRLSRSAALHWIRKIALRLDPGLGDISDRVELTLRLRNFVHHRVRQGGNTPKWPGHDAYERFLQAIVSREEGVSCQGAAWLYRDLLNAFGIRAREVSLFSPNPAVNHASVEVRAGGRWIVMDPTFNVSFTDGSERRLSYQAMRHLRRWTIQYDGMVARHGWVIDVAAPYARYLQPYARYLHRIEYPPQWV
jgi:Transglutaminase-like superfamily